MTVAQSRHVAMFIGLLLSACGGDDAGRSVGDLAPSLTRAQALADRGGATARHAVLDTSGLHPEGEGRRRALAVDVDFAATTASAAAAAEALMDFAQRQLPQYFPGQPASQSAGTLTYRHYPQTGAYLIVNADAQVYVMGGPFGAGVMVVGTVSDFLQTLSGSVGGLRTSGLQLRSGSETLTVPAGATSFAFKTMVAKGSVYSVGIAVQPSGQTCSVANATGTAGTAVPPPAILCPSISDPLAPGAPVSYGDAAVAYGVDVSGISGGDFGGDGTGGDGGDGGAAGAAGDGAPLTRARVTLTDVQGRVVSGLTDANGRYFLRFDTARFSPPYLLRVIDATGAVRTSIITERIRSNTVVWANINPFTDKLVSDALRAGVGGTDKAFSASDIDSARLARAATDLVTSVRGALTTAGVADSSRFDAVRSRFAMDGTGVDAVLDSLNHTRDPSTGATQLRTKLATVVQDSRGTELPRLVTVSSPLNAALLALPGSDTLTHGKLQAWVDELNRCLSKSATAYGSDADCTDVEGVRLVHRGYKSNSKDFREDLRTLFSEIDGSPVSGSMIRNASILYVARSAGSAVDDLSIVQFTFFQPYVGPRGPNGPVGGAVEYPVTTVFKRDATLTRAKAGNWILFGNQLDHDLAIEPRYYRFNQANPERQATAPSYVNSSLRLLAMRKRWNVATQSYVDANIRAIRVTGPGLPAGGVVLAPSAACGAVNYLAVLNKTGEIPTTSTQANRVQNDFRLASVDLLGRRFITPGNYFPARDMPINAIPYVTDFAPIRAYSTYRFEIFLNQGTSNSVADRVEQVRLLAPLMPPELALRLPMNDPTLSTPLVAFGGAAVPANAAAAVNWTNNPLASPVGAVSIYAEELVPSGTSVTLQFYSIRTSVPGAYSTRAVPSAQLLTVPSVSVDPACAGGRLPAYDGVSGVYREVTLTTLQGQARVFSSLGWNR
jgi:hypothetical protein